MEVKLDAVANARIQGLEGERAMTAGGVMTMTGQVFTTFADNQPVPRIQGFEGKRAITEDNNILGKFQLDDIPPATRGVPLVEATLDTDAIGCARVASTELPRASIITNALSNGPFCGLHGSSRLWTI